MRSGAGWFKVVMEMGDDTGRGSLFNVRSRLTW